MKGITLLVVCVVALASGNQINSDPSEAPGICSSSESDGVLVAHENCNQFYKCAHGIPVALSCPYDHLYNPEKEYCDWPWDVNCGDRIIPNAAVSRHNQNHRHAASICSNEDSDGLLVAHENCNQFYQCIHGEIATLNCPSNLLFNIDKEVCDWPSNVNCGERDPNPALPRDKQGYRDASQADSICSSEYSDGVLVPHENCNQFYKCTFGKPVALDCPVNLVYNIDQEYCDWPANVQCGERQIPSKAVVRQGSKVCTSGFFGNVAHERCDAFYMCVAGHSIEIRCPLTLYYDADKEVCNDASAVNCEGRVV